MKAYGPRGLNVRAVYDGRRSTIASVSRHIKKEKIGYPVLFDCGARMKKDLGVRAYPAAFLIGRKGKVVWEGTLGKGGRRTVEAMIEKLTKRE